MKKFESVLIVLVVIFIGIMTYGMFSAGQELRQQKLNEQRMLKRENAQYQSDLSHYEVVLGKYTDSISDEMLRDFYPQETDLTSLRSHLKEKYEIRMRTERDGLCY